MNSSLSHVVALIIHYKYLIIFPWAIIEGPIITVIAGFLASLGQVNFFLVYVIVVAGDMVGDAVYYAIGYWGGRRFIGRWGKYLGMTPERLARVEVSFHRNGAKIIVIGKIHSLGSIILTSAGISKMNFRKFMWWNFWPTLAKSMALLLIGYFFGSAYEAIDRYLKNAGILIIILTILVVAGYYILQKRAKNKLP